MGRTYGWKEAEEERACTVARVLAGHPPHLGLIGAGADGPGSVGCVDPDDHEITVWRPRGFVWPFERGPRVAFGIERES